jgi:hypothetical protein
VKAFKYPSFEPMGGVPALNILDTKPPPTINLYLRTLQETLLASARTLPLSTCLHGKVSSILVHGGILPLAGNGRELSFGVLSMTADKSEAPAYLALHFACLEMVKCEGSLSPASASIISRTVGPPTNTGRGTHKQV